MKFRVGAVITKIVRYSEVDVTVQIIMVIGVIGILQDEVLKMEYNQWQSKINDVT